MTRHRPLLFILLSLALVRGFIYAWAVPPWQAPDEPAQFERARASLTAAEWQSTTANPPEWYRALAQSMFTFNHWDYLPSARATYQAEAPLSNYVALYAERYRGWGGYANRLPSAVLAGLLFLAPRQDVAFQLYLVRLNTVAMSVAIIGLAYLLTKTIFPTDTFLTFGVPLLILFTPQHTHMLSTVNNGNLAEIFTLLVLYFLVKSLINGYTWLTLAAILAGTAAAVATKATAYFLVFVIAAAALLFVWQYKKYWYWLLLAGLMLGIAYLVIPAAMYQSFVPVRIYKETERVWQFWQQGNIYLDPIVPEVLFRSFWAMPGWLILQLHPFWYQLLLAACTLAVAGLILLAITRRRALLAPENRPRVQALVILAVALAASVGILLATNAIRNITIYRQGRSIYPVIVPVAIFLMLGWRQLIPATWRNFGLLALTAAFFLFDTLVLFHYIIPFFYSRY